MKDMNVKCISNNSGDYIYLTVGKEYTYINIFHQVKYYRIIDDTNSSNVYPMKCFLTLEEYRNRKLEEIGI